MNIKQAKGQGKNAMEVYFVMNKQKTAGKM